MATLLQLSTLSPAIASLPPSSDAVKRHRGHHLKERLTIAKNSTTVASQMTKHTSVLPLLVLLLLLLLLQMW